jgi:hypothetical protein
MDSNFQVRISADLTEFYRQVQQAANALTQLDGVVRDVGKAADYASTSIGFKLGEATKQMGEKASTAGKQLGGLGDKASEVGVRVDRTRQLSFAFGQVLRDSGFFAQSFGLGMLAISNNIPILIDQLVIAIPALQAFQGSITIISSLLTAALTIWAYSSTAVKENTESVEEYVSKLDDLREARVRGEMDAASEIRTLKLLRIAAQDETFSKEERLKAVKELQDRFPDYYANLSAEEVMTGKDADANYRLAKALIAVANARATQELITENRKVELKEAQKLIDLQKEKKTLENKPTGIQASKTGENYKLKGKIADIDNQIFETEKRKNEARDTANKLEENLLNTLKKQKDVSLITGDVGGASGAKDKPKGKPKTGAAAPIKDTPYQSLQKSLDAINIDPTTSKLQKLNAEMGAYRNTIKTLIDANVNQASPAFLDLVARLDSTSQAYETLKTSTENSEIATKKQEQALKDISDITKSLDFKKLDISQSIGLEDSAKIKQEIEAISDAILGLQKIALESPEAAKFAELESTIASLRAELDRLGVSYQAAINQDAISAVKKKFEGLIPTVQELTTSMVSTLSSGFSDVISTFADSLGQLMSGEISGKEFGKSITDSIGNFLSTLGKQMVSFGVAAVAFGLLKKAIKDSKNPAVTIGAGFALIAAGAALGVIGGAIRRTAGGGGGGGGDQPAPSPTPTFGGLTTYSANTGIDSSYSMSASSQPTLETRISGNDLVILMNKSSNARKGYY